MHFVTTYLRIHLVNIFEILVTAYPYIHLVNIFEIIVTIYLHIHLVNIFEILVTAYPRIHLVNIFEIIVTAYPHIHFLCSLYSSGGKGPFMASKAKNKCQRCTFLEGRGGSAVRDMAPPLGARFSETLFPHFKIYHKTPKIPPKNV